MFSLIHRRDALRDPLFVDPQYPDTAGYCLLVRDRRDGGEAEYWYLRWWSTIEQKYRYPYRETNRHTYMLVKTSEGWQVEENIHPAPRSSTPHRQRK